MKEQMKRYLRGLPNVESSGERFQEKELRAQYNRIDLSDAKGKKLMVKTKFTNYLDLSDGEFDEVFLEGVFNIVDASGAKIGLLDRKRAEIWDFDNSEAKIKKTEK